MTKPFHTIVLATLLLSATAALAQTTRQTVTEQSVTTPPVRITETVEKSRTFTGTISSIDPKLSNISMSTEGSAAPVSYVFTEETKFFDSTGRPLTPQALELGAPATLHYVQAGDRLVVMKVTVTRPVTVSETNVMQVQPAPVEQRVIVKEPAPRAVVIEEKVKPAPVLEEKTVVKKKKAPVRPELIEKETTTTTTTTTE